MVAPRAALHRHLAQRVRRARSRSPRAIAQAPLLSVETLVFPFSFVLSALLLGAAATGMLLGHWYLIDRDLSLQPLEQTLALYRRCLELQVGLLVVMTLLLGVAGAPPARAAVQAPADRPPVAVGGARRGQPARRRRCSAG